MKTRFGEGFPLFGPAPAPAPPPSGPGGFTPFRLMTNFSRPAPAPPPPPSPIVTASNAALAALAARNRAANAPVMPALAAPAPVPMMSMPTPVSPADVSPDGPMATPYVVSAINPDEAPPPPSKADKIRAFLKSPVGMISGGVLVLTLGGLTIWAATKK